MFQDLLSDVGLASSNTGIATGAAKVGAPDTTTSQCSIMTAAAESFLATYAQCIEFIILFLKINI